DEDLGRACALDSRSAESALSRFTIGVATRSSTTMAIMPAHRVVAQPLSWLWQDRIPLGKLLILDGDPDLGKSLLALDLCARLSTGRPFPDGQAAPGPANALVLNAEDSPVDTIVPRLRQLGANLERAFVS